MPEYAAWAFWLSLALLPCALPAAAQPQQPPVRPAAGSAQPDPQRTGASANEQPPDHRLPGSITGTMVDPTGAAVAGARVRISHGDQSAEQEALSGDDGQYWLHNVSPGPFQLTIALVGFTTQASSGILRSEGKYRAAHTEI